MDQIIEILRENQLTLIFISGIIGPFVISFFKRLGAKAKYVLLAISLVVAIVYTVLANTIGVEAMVLGLTKGFAIAGIAVSVYEVVYKRFIQE